MSGRTARSESTNSALHKVVSSVDIDIAYNQSQGIHERERIVTSVDVEVEGDIRRERNDHEADFPLRFKGIGNEERDANGGKRGETPDAIFEGESVVFQARGDPGDLRSEKSVMRNEPEGGGGGEEQRDAERRQEVFDPQHGPEHSRKRRLKERRFQGGGISLGLFSRSAGWVWA